MNNKNENNESYKIVTLLISFIMILFVLLMLNISVFFKVLALYTNI